MAVTLLDEVGEAPGAGDDDVGTVAQRGDLRVLRGSAEDCRGAQAHDTGQRREHGLDLAGQFTGWHQHQSARPARHGMAARQPGDQREGECERLARTRAAAAKDVQAGQGVGQRGGLDRERGGDSGAGKRRHQRRGNAERSKGGSGRCGSLGGTVPTPGSMSWLTEQSWQRNLFRTWVAASEATTGPWKPARSPARHDRRALMATPSYLQCSPYSTPCSAPGRAIRQLHEAAVMYSHANGCRGAGTQATPARAEGHSALVPASLCAGQWAT